MQQIQITNQHNEMKELGKLLFQENKKVYDDRMIRMIYNIIDEHIPNASKEEKEDVFFRSVYDYWVYGNNIAEEFYFDFANKTHEEKLEYITYRLRFLYMNHLNSKETRHYLDNKWDAYNLMKPYYRRDAILLKDEQDYDKFCEFIDKHPTFVVKPIGLSAGSGVHKESAEGADRKELFHKILGESVTLTKNHPFGNASAMMLEEIIKQAPEMASLHPASLQSIRLVTVKLEDRVHIWYPRMDIGRDGGFLINGAAGGIMAVIDPKTGVIMNKGLPESGEAFEYHPNTGVRILGFQIPKWNELIEMATHLMLHVLPDTRYVGWDMALSEKGWCVVEGNWAGEFVGDQLGHGRGLRREFEELIGWKPTQTYWWEKG